jgi:hypothetical protein
MPLILPMPRDRSAALAVYRQEVARIVEVFERVLPVAGLSDRFSFLRRIIAYDSMTRSLAETPFILLTGEILCPQ